MVRHLDKSSQEHPECSYDNNACTITVKTRSGHSYGGSYHAESEKREPFLAVLAVQFGFTTRQ